MTRELRVDLTDHPSGPDDNEEEFLASITAQDGHVFIGLKPETAPRTRDTGIVPPMGRDERNRAHEYLESRGVVIEHVFASFPAVYAVVPLDEVMSLADDPRINYIEPIGTGYLHTLPRTKLASIPVSLFQQQDTAWGVFMVRGPQAWTDNIGHNASITILDTGVGYDHLLGGDGPVRLNECRVGLPSIYPTCFDLVGHGSHVAGIAAARDDGQGYIGMIHYEGITGRPLASVKVCGPSDTNPDPDHCNPAAVAIALDWTTDNEWDRQVINMSFGVPPSTTLASAVTSSHAAGNLLVAAAGNDVFDSDPPVSWPARYSEVMAVSGTWDDDTFAHWITCPGSEGEGGSVFGPEVEISAPFGAFSMWTNGTYEGHCGTSMSAPHVSGAAALIWTKNPSWTNEQVRNHLRSTARDLGTPGPDPLFGHGRLDAGAAVGIPIPSVSISGPVEITTSDNYMWTANPSGGVGGYTYTWYRQIDYWWPRGAATCHYQTPWVQVGTGSTYSDFVDTMDYDFRLRVDIVSGDEEANGGHFVLVGDGSQECPML